MLTVVCGEDSISSRNYLVELKNSFHQKNSEIVDIVSSRIDEILKWQGESMTLFSRDQVFFTENLRELVNKKSSLKWQKTIEKIVKLKRISLIDFEDEISSRYLKFPLGTIVKEFKPKENIFKFLDLCFPSNLKNFLISLDSLVKTIDENIIFYMLYKHIRNLLIIKSGQSIPRLQTWQIAKLKKQAYNWEEKKLLSFYEGLHKIDISTKTSTNPYSIKKSLDILACYFL